MKFCCCSLMTAVILVIAPRVATASTLRCLKEKSMNCVIPSLVQTSPLQEINLPDLRNKSGLQIVAGYLTAFSEKLSSKLATVVKLQLGPLQLKEIFLKPELVELVAGGNQIEAIKFKTNAEYQLKVLDLSDNRLKNLDGFELLKGLRELHLGGNALEFVDLRVFSDMSNLKKLTLERNQLTTVLATEPIELPALEYLSLSRNKLTNLDVSNWQLESLTECDVSSNDLVHVDMIENQFPSLQKISLIKNWWHCSWLDDVVKEFNKNSVTIADRDETCENSQNVSNICCVALIDNNGDELGTLSRLKEEQTKLRNTLQKVIKKLGDDQETKLRNLERAVKNLESKAQKLLPISAADSLSKLEFVELKERAQTLKSSLKEQLDVWKKQKQTNELDKQRLQHTIVDQRRALDRVTQKIKETQAQFALLRDYVGSNLKRRN